jgi:polyribonucleotide nucleotidyltransferase
MPLSATELRLLEEACATRENQTARELLNVFGATTAAEVLRNIADAPVTIRGDFMTQVRKAIDEQRRFRPRR